MKYLIYVLLASQALISAKAALSQAIYGPQGQYLGYSQTSTTGVTNVYTPNGQLTGSTQVQGQQTNVYGPQGQYMGNSQAPITTPPSTTLIFPREVNQAPSIRGW